MIRLFNAGATIVTDVMILCLPVPQIWKLQHLRVTEKLGLSVVFALGFLSVTPSPFPPSPLPPIPSLVSLSPLSLVSETNKTTTRDGFDPEEAVLSLNVRPRSVVFAASYRISVFMHDVSEDMTYTLAPDAGWTVIEMTAAIVSTSFPTLGPALIELNKKLRSCSGFRKFRTADYPNRRQTDALRRHDMAGSSTGNHTGEEDDDGTIYNLSDFMKGHDGSGSKHADVSGDRPVTRGTGSHEDKALSLSVTRSQDGASDEFPLNGIRPRRSASHSYT